MKHIQVNSNLSGVEMLEDLAYKLSQDAAEVYIVNAGLMNAGKSSLFNALTNQEELFKVQDVPTTVICKTVELFKGINLIDTPGIEARNADTVEAYKAYRNADMILFVHNVNMGELHEDELKAINSICQEFPKEQDFWRRFCLVVSRGDAKEDEDINFIINKLKADIQKHCGGEKFPLFITSSVRYWKGIQQSQQVFIEKSGIVQLRNFLLEKSAELKVKAIGLREERLNHAKRKELLATEEQKKVYADKIASRQREHTAKIARTETDLKRIQNATKSMWENCRDLASEVRNLS